MKFSGSLIYHMLHTFLSVETDNTPIHHVLKGICQQQVLTHESLVTLMCEIEAKINSRPLASLWWPKWSHTTDTYNVANLGVSLKSISRDRQQGPLCSEAMEASAISDWPLFVQVDKRTPSEYLQNWSVKENLQVRDFLLVDDKLPRGLWLLGRFVEVFPDGRGLVRKVRLKTVEETYLRPIQNVLSVRKWARQNLSE